MRMKKLLPSMLLALSLTAATSSCVTEEPKRQSTEIQRGVRPTEQQLRTLMEDAARAAVDRKSRAISPNTRHEMTYTCDEKAISYDAQSDQATVEVTLRWKARKALLSEGKHDFELRGRLTVSLSFRPDSYPAIFTPSYANEVTKEVGKGDASSVASFDVYKK